VRLAPTFYLFFSPNFCFNTLGVAAAGAKCVALKGSVAEIQVAGT
jgi:hypothetical protein